MLIHTGFLMSDFSACGVREGSQKLGNCLAFPPVTLDIDTSLLGPAFSVSKWRNKNT